MNQLQVFNNEEFGQVRTVVQGVKQKPSGEPFTWTTTYVMPKGQAYIIDRLKKEQEQEAV